MYVRAYVTKLISLMKLMRCRHAPHTMVAPIKPDTHTHRYFFFCFFFVFAHKIVDDDNITAQFVAYNNMTMVSAMASAVYRIFVRKTKTKHDV